jgi:hypothetical protein
MTQPPNILCILSDQHNAKVLGCARDGVVRTPNLDRLAAEGVLCEQAYCQNPLCVPSRASMLTGQHCRTVGIYENTDMDDPCEEYNLVSEASVRAVVPSLKAEVFAFWKPDAYLGRMSATPKARREKHFYEFSNQFMLGNGVIANARP